MQSISNNENLSNVDFKILKHIYTKGEALSEDIETHFYKVDNIRYYINNLWNNGYLTKDCDRVVNGVVFKSLNSKTLYLTEKGISALQNKSSNKKLKKKKTILENILLPILVTLITTFLIFVIELLLKKQGI